ncbi:MAG: polysaccharide biosynthesis C-terminal domain-containing protein [Flavobacteriales bacterium]|nr:polysaccharide biosynthesis C-terminal domain-containing protein [Flavobacteriales bacterium]
MGIIQKQALRSTIANYVGVGFGAFTRLFLALFATNLQIGVIDLIEAVSGSFAAILNFGYNQVLLRLFPKYRDEKNGHHGFLLFGIFLSIFGASLGVGIYFLFFDFFTPGEEGEQYIHIFTLFLPFLILARLLYRNLDGYARMLFATVLGTVLESVVLKGVVMSGVLLTFYGVFVFEQLLLIYILAFSIPGIVVMLFVFFKTKKVILPKKEIFSENKKQLPSLMLFGVLVGASGSIIMYVDKFMINEMVGTDAVGVYGQMFFAALLVSMVSRGIKRISGTVLAEAWNKNDLDNIQSIYRKSCLNQMVIAFFFLLVGWACIVPATDLLGKYQEGVYVFLFLGLGQLFDMMTGVNTEIISTSKNYKFNTYFNLVLAALVIALNALFINWWNINGAAFASFCAIVIVNTSRWYFLKRKYNFQPFDKRFFGAMIPGVLLMLLISFADYDLPNLYKILINGVVVSVVYWFIVLKFNLSEEITAWLIKVGLRKG